MAKPVRDLEARVSDAARARVRARVTEILQAIEALTWDDRVVHVPDRLVEQYGRRHSPLRSRKSGLCHSR
jgi:hypothetical protein